MTHADTHTSTTLTTCPTHGERTTESEDLVLALLRAIINDAAHKGSHTEEVHGYDYHAYGECWVCCDEMTVDPDGLLDMNGLAFSTDEPQDNLSPAAYAKQVETAASSHAFATLYDRDYWIERAGDAAHDYAIDVATGRKAPVQFAADYLTREV